MASAFDDSFHRIADAIFHDVGLAELEAVTEDGDVARAFAEEVGILRGFLAEAFSQQPAIMFGGQDLRALRVDAAVADADFIHLIHQLRDQIKAKAGAAERGDLPFGREDHARVLDRVLEVVVAYHPITLL